MENVELVQCTVIDVEELQEISIETFSDTFKEQNTTENLTEFLNKNYNLAQLTGELQNPNSFFFFLKKLGKTIGYLKLNIGNAQSEDTAENALEVERIYIRTPYLGQGYGKYLMSYAEQVAVYLNKSIIWLGVWEYNFNAISFYEKRGFEQNGSHTFFMGDDPQKDLILQKKIER
ncbi:GNAT family N-acetyltransferase [Tetragenococcus solitarius]|uniref:Spermidine/spermine N(1)-acetyltransferase n=1 Tax=Tetragenococcus solitarius TaxID=71453 RepID=A0ABN3YAR3_9ENTE|nr:GNAT family N-acetyltransferase [Tetragenococcus solitarius]